MSLFSKPNTRDLPPPPTLPTQENPETAAARRREQEAGNRARGLAATRITGGEGVTGAATLARRRLLGE